uniref:CCHC-type domain-containing protein n=1 Tax=Tanacetum cinerariifolium TaxID=118510 RepID=A0A699HPI5_TANCI|nr:hypothetical protein [Tanacetum cinerariifolium]
MIQMLQNINREDLKTLWKLVKAKYGNTSPEEAYERVLWGDLKVMFESDIESEVWRELQGNKVTIWKLFSSCGIHFVRFQNLHIFMLVEKRLCTFSNSSRPKPHFQFHRIYPIFESQEMSTSNTHQQSLADVGSKTRPPILERGPYEFRIFTPSETEAPRMQKEEDLRGDDLKHYEAEIEAMNLILISIPNDICKSMDACTSAKAMWQRVERLMRGTMQNKVDRETCFNNEFNQFFAKSGKPLVTIYNQDSYDDLFDYLQQFEKLVNASRAKKLEKSHDPLALLAHMGSFSITTTPYYVTHPSLLVDYDDDYQGDVVQNNFEDPLTSSMILLTRVITAKIQSKNSGNDGRNTTRSYIQEEIVKGNNFQKDAGNIQRTLQTVSLGTTANVQCYNYSKKGHYARNCPKPRVQDSKYFMEQMLLAK